MVMKSGKFMKFCDMKINNRRITWDGGFLCLCFSGTVAVVVGVAGRMVASEIEKKVCKVIGKYINRFVLLSHRPCVGGVPPRGILTAHRDVKR